MLNWYFSNNLDIYDYVGKVLAQNFSVWLFSIQGNYFLFLLQFNEARISKWNTCLTGLLQNFYMRVRRVFEESPVLPGT